MEQIAEVWITIGTSTALILVLLGAMLDSLRNRRRD